MKQLNFASIKFYNKSPKVQFVPVNEQNYNFRKVHHLRTIPMQIGIWSSFQMKGILSFLYSRYSEKK